MKQKFSMAMSLAVILAMLLTSFALADGYSVDNDVFSPGNQNSDTLSAAPGATVNSSADIVVDWQGQKHLSPNTAISFSVDAQKTDLPAGYSVSTVSSSVPGDWDDTTDYFIVGASSISFTAPSVPGSYTYTVKWMNTQDTCLPGDNGCLSGGADAFTIYLTVTGHTNTPPTVSADNNSVTVDEGSLANNTGTYSDADGDSVALSASVGNIVGNANGTWNWSFSTTDGPAESQTVTITADDGQAQASTTFDLTVNNVNPIVAAPSWNPASVACRKPVTLQGISFSDPGTIDNPWNVNIAWGDASADTNYNTNTQGAQSDQSHTYNFPGTYSATVGVTDKDSGYGSAQSASLNVLQTYTVRFLQPFDGSSPSNLITNTMKSGRVVPVKVTIYDDCAQAYVTDPATMVKIFVSLASSNNTSNDAVETYADAGASNGNTLYFRWTSDTSAPGGGFWIYNLDSKTVLGGSALAINKTYRVDVYIGNVKATVTTWALLTPVK
jgi:hypothetical protein